MTTNAVRILSALDAKLLNHVELTLYGRAALTLGFGSMPEDYALSQDVDAVLWVGQAEELARTTNFWEAIEEVNAELAPEDLFVSHFFEENQVILRPQWRRARVRIGGSNTCSSID